MDRTRPTGKRPSPTVPSPVLRSRRAPRLRVVGVEPDATRPAALVTKFGRSFVLEVTSFDAMAATPRRLWPKEAWIIPNVGFVTFTAPASDLERLDLLDVVEQQKEAWRERIAD